MSASTKILLVDDEPEIRSMLSIFLGVQDFAIIEAESGKDAVRKAIVEKPDAILLDLGLPDMDGTEVLSTLRQFSQVPIIVLTVRSDDAQVVKALSLGANDYVTKPFRAEVLLARINANLRGRPEKDDGIPTIENGPIRIDLIRHEVHLQDQLVAFTAKEFALLQYFASNSGRMLTHKQILKAVWGPTHVDDTQYLRVYIGQIREKLEAVPGLGKAITSESGIGYRMETLTAVTAASLESLPGDAAE